MSCAALTRGHEMFSITLRAHTMAFASRIVPAAAEAAHEGAPVRTLFWQCEAAATRRHFADRVSDGIAAPSPVCAAEGAMVLAVLLESSRGRKLYGWAACPVPVCS